MCGLVAVCSSGPAAPDTVVAETALEAATAALRHRGPDAQAVWLAPDGRAGLGHTRLGIIDPAGGHQPLVSEDGTVQAVVNGELYDFEPLRGRLEREGHRFRTGSDSEVALHLYEDGGEHCLSELRGEFALAVWDARRRRLFAARDRFGIKPLYYARHAGLLWLASEAKALFAAGVPAVWDQESIGHVLHLGVPLPHRSLFRGVFQVPAGHFLTAGEHGLEVRRYWDLDFDASHAAAPDQTATAAGEPVERFRGALEEAVRTRLRADVPVACYLSGGVDSSAILGLAARHAPRRLRAFTIRFADPAHDESQPARTAAARCGAELVEVPVDGRALADAFEAAVGHGETAVVNAHGVAKFLLSRAVREAGGKVVLTGEGADEMLGGYAHFRRDVARHGAAGLPPDDRNRLARWLRAAEAASAASAPRRAAFFDAAAPLRAAVGFVPSWLEAQFGVACRQQGWLADGFARRIAPRDSFGALADALALDGRIRRWEPLHRSLYLYAHTNLPNYVLSVLGDRMEMAHSVEGRVPFLDHRVAELAASLPASSKVRGRIEKYVLREAARPLLTDEAYRRPKHPFVAPPALLDRGALWERMESELRGPALDALPFYDPRSVRQTLDRLPDLPTRARLDLDPALTVAASLCVLQRRFRPAAGES